jgi:hypothetical protein
MMPFPFCFIVLLLYHKQNLPCIQKKKGLFKNPSKLTLSALISFFGRMQNSSPACLSAVEIKNAYCYNKYIINKGVFMIIAKQKRGAQWDRFISKMLMSFQ